ncbi:MAG: hypothetical protein ACP5HM_05070 [Anaerolineae bacterium]
MNETLRLRVESTFNVAYLMTIWGLVSAMARQRARLLPQKRDLARLFTLAFGLLALGDTGHVGFRVLGYLRGDLETTVTFLGQSMTLVGLGALSTAVTVTFFYVLLLVIWHRRFDKPYGWPGALLFAAAVVRLVLMALPQNHWGRLTPPWPWSLYRNLPLMAQGLGVAYLILRDAWAADDWLFKRVGALILVSYAFYMPVIFFVRQVPWLGMLMIPKTLAYVGIAGLTYAWMQEQRVRGTAPA